VPNGLIDRADLELRGGGGGEPPVFVEGEEEDRATSGCFCGVSFPQAPLKRSSSGVPEAPCGLMDPTPASSPVPDSAAQYLLTTTLVLPIEQLAELEGGGGWVGGGRLGGEGGVNALGREGGVSCLFIRRGRWTLSRRKCIFDASAE